MSFYVNGIHVMILNMTAWTDHVRSMASQLGLTYMCASTDPRVKNSYNKAPRVSKPLTDEQKKRRRAARLIKIGNNALSLNPVPPRPRKRPVKRDVKEAVSEFLAGAITEATTTMPAPKKKRAKPGQGKERGTKKMSEETKALLKARRQGSKMKPPKPPTTFTPLSADEMAYHANLLG
jgi:hypothetical protein